MDAIYLSRKQISYQKVSVSMVNLYKYITQSFRTQGNSIELAKPRGRPSNRWSNGYNNNDNNCALMKEVFLNGTLDMKDPENCVAAGNYCPTTCLLVMWKLLTQE